MRYHSCFRGPSGRRSSFALTSGSRREPSRLIGAAEERRAAGDEVVMAWLDDPCRDPRLERGRIPIHPVSAQGSLERR
jgi:hypothetical protein